MTITLNPDQEMAIQEAIRGGKFASADEYIAAAIATLRHRPAAPTDSSRREAVCRMREFGEKYRLQLGGPVTRKLLHTAHRH